MTAAAGRVPEAMLEEIADLTVEAERVDRQLFAFLARMRDLRSRYENTPSVHGADGDLDWDVWEASIGRVDEWVAAMQWRCSRYTGCMTQAPQEQYGIPLDY